MRTFILSSFAFIVCFSAGYFFLFDGGKSSAVQRDPASISKNFDFTSLADDELEEAIKERLIGGLKVSKSNNGHVDLQLGHFYLANNDGAKSRVCDEFSKIKITFEAEGVALSGERPSMEVFGECQSEVNSVVINPLVIPVKEFMAKAPFEGDFQDRQNGNVSLRFFHTPDDWPLFWVLKEVNFETKDGEEIEISREEISKILGRPFGLSFE